MGGINVRDHSGLLLFFFIFFFRISPSLLFPRKLRVLIDSAIFGEGRVTTRSTGRARGLMGRGARRSQPHRQPIWRAFYRRLAVANERARTLAPNRRRGVLLCSDFSEHTRPPRSTGDGPPGPRQALVSSPTATPSLSAWSVLTLAQCGLLSAHRQKGGDTSSHAWYHLDMANAWRVS